MPIRREHRFFYPIDWPQLSAVIRFPARQGPREGCGRPHGETVWHLGDGRWWDAQPVLARRIGEAVCLAIGGMTFLEPSGRHGWF